MIRLRSSSGPDSRLSYRRLLLLSIIVFSIFWPSAHANCYYPDGTDQNRNLDKSYFQPCDPGDEHSMCCALNMTTPEECRSDGLCHNLIDRQLWREGCTDPTWKSSKCIKLYVSGLAVTFEGTPGDLSNINAVITICKDGRYCLGNGTFGEICCREDSGVFVSNGQVVSDTGSSSSMRAYLSSSSLSSIKANLSPSPRKNVSHTIDIVPRTSTSQDSLTSISATFSSLSSSAANSSDKTGVIVGGVIGGGALLAFISGIIAWTKMQHNRRNSSRNEITQTAWIGQTDSEEHVASEDNGIHEVDSKKPTMELESRPIAELESRPTAELETRPFTLQP